MKWATAFIALKAVARFTGSDVFCFVILGLRSQSLAPPQALCCHLLRRFGVHNPSDPASQVRRLQPSDAGVRRLFCKPPLANH